MAHVNSRRVVVLVLTLILTLCVGTVQAQEYRYRFVSLGGIEVPQGFDPFFWVGSFFLSVFEDHKAINNSGKIYGQVFDESFAPHIAVYAQGKLTFVPEASLFGAANDAGTIGGSVLVDPANFVTQAALFHGDAAGHYRVELIPPLPGEYTSTVIRLNDSGVALVSPWDGAFNETRFLYRNGQVQPVDFGSTIAFPSHLNLNTQGIISGTGRRRRNPRPWVSLQSADGRGDAA